MKLGEKSRVKDGLTGGDPSSRRVMVLLVCQPGLLIRLTVRDGRGFAEEATRTQTPTQTQSQKTSGRVRVEPLDRGTGDGHGDGWTRDT